MSYLDTTFIVLLILKYYDLIEIGWGWVAFWGVIGFVISIASEFAKERK